MEILSRSQPGIFLGELEQRSYFQIPYKGLLWRSLIQDLFKSLAKRPLLEILHSDLARAPLLEILCKEIAQRSVPGILPTGLLHQSCQESLHRRFQQEILHRDIAQRSVKVFPRSPLRYLAKRPLIEILYRDLARAPLQGTLCRDISQFIEICCVDLAKRSLT